MSYFGTEIKTSLRTARTAVGGLEQMVQERLENDLYDPNRKGEGPRLSEWYARTDAIMDRVKSVMDMIEEASKNVRQGMPQ